MIGNIHLWKKNQTVVPRQFLPPPPPNCFKVWYKDIYKETRLTFSRAFLCYYTYYLILQASNVDAKPVIFRHLDQYLETPSDVQAFSGEVQLSLQVCMVTNLFRNCNATICNIMYDAKIIFLIVDTSTTETMLFIFYWFLFYEFVMIRFMTNVTKMSDIYLAQGPLVFEGNIWKQFMKIFSKTFF